MWVKRLIAVLAGVLVLLALFAAWTVFRVKADLAQAAEHATGLEGRRAARGPAASKG